MRHFVQLITSVIFAVSPVVACTAQSTPPGASADAVLSRLESEAAAANKHILLQFGASWCGNCKLFDIFFNDPTIHPILSKAFVFGEMATGEHGNQTRYVNLPGGPALQASLGGKDAGWPYLVMLDEHGALLASSQRPREGNIGYPATASEIAWFTTMLQKAAPQLTPGELETIQTWLRVHSPEHP